MDSQGYVSPEEVRSALRSLYHADPETNMRQALLRSLADDLKPRDENGRWRPSSLMVLVLCIAFALTGVFFYFTVGGHR